MTCAWPYCKQVVPSSRLMCRRHWATLPKNLQDPIWAAYKPGQTAATCSPEYRQALADVLAWARERQRALDAREGLW